MSKSFGSAVKEARKRAGLSQRELATQVKIDYTYLSKIERGKVDPPSERVVKALADALGIERDQLLFYADKAPRDLDAVITEGPYIPSILRRARGLTKKDWEEIGDLIDKKRREGS